ncbi:MAG: septum formation protein Maf [Betaproteobacteria bacterium RIFCSPLOWO2_12_FULL_64_23]|nr:MAG: septum formation protein Maf [Betaproteobacteria bacterium RIFCSPLOWO2_12_FULL_64_23]
MPQIVLASTSKYRRELLARLGLPFEIASPQVDETALPDEAPQDTARRLAEAKARAVAARFPQAIIIGSDQVAVLEGKTLGKPGNHANALHQLKAMRGKEVVFHTALCLCNAASGQAQTRVVPVYVRLRDYSDAQIERYLQREQPYDCAGSARAEGLGIALIAGMRGNDPNALIGLPLIALTEMLAAQGVSVL